MSGASAARAPRDIRERAFDFAVRVVRLCQFLDKTPGTPRTLARQLLRSGTSIGANLEEADGAQTKADFIFKNSVALKEARETCYWLRLLVATEVVSEARILPLHAEAGELAKIIAAIIVSARRRSQK